jgi:hypothetical protein
LTLLTDKNFQEAFQNGEDGGTGVYEYMRKGTAWRVMAADRPYGEFYELYSVRPEYFGCHLVYINKKIYRSKFVKKEKPTIQILQENQEDGSILRIAGTLTVRGRITPSSSNT